MPASASRSRLENNVSACGVVNVVTVSAILSAGQVMPSVPIAAAGHVARCQIWRKYSQTEVLPFVPVTPTNMPERRGQKREHNLP